jgi:hypothetical protein
MAAASAGEPPSFISRGRLINSSISCVCASTGARPLQGWFAAILEGKSVLLQRLTVLPPSQDRIS